MKMLWMRRARNHEPPPMSKKAQFPMIFFIASEASVQTDSSQRLSSTSVLIAGRGTSSGSKLPERREVIPHDGAAIGFLSSSIRAVTASLSSLRGPPG